MAVFIQHIYVCDYCGATEGHQTQGNIEPYSVLSIQPLLSGWTWIGRRLVCPRHDIVVKGKQDKRND